MKYKLYLEEEYKDFNGDLEEDMTVECSDFIMLEHELKQYCEHLYDNRDGWEWMKNSNERIVAVNENGEVFYFQFMLQYEPYFYVSESKD